MSSPTSRLLRRSNVYVCRQLEDLGQDTRNPLMLQIVRNKLPSSVLSDLIRMERNAEHAWGMAEVRSGLAEILAIREEVQRCSMGSQNRKPQLGYRNERRERQYSGSRRQNPAQIFSAAQQPKPAGDRKPTCLFCGKDHWASDCPVVSKLDKRRQMLNEQNRCLNCLRRGHREPDCRRKRCCRRCGEAHHIALCPQHRGCTEPRSNTGRGRSTQGRRQGQSLALPVTGANAVPIQEKAPANAIMAVVASHHSDPAALVPSNPQLVLLMAIRIQIFADSAPRKRIPALAFFDPGAQMTLVKSSLVKQLSLPKVQDDELEVNYFHAPHPMKMNAPQHVVSIVLNDGGVHRLVAHRTDWIVPSVRYAGCEVEAMVPVDEEPDLLIGMADFWSFVRGLEQIGDRLFKVNMSVGTVLCGRRQEFSGSPSSRSLAAVLSTVPQPDVQVDLVKHFWDLQLIGIRDDPQEKDDETAQRLFEESVTRLEDGRYSVGWPWKAYPPDLPSNFAMAYRRLDSLIKRLRSTPELMAKYEEKIQEQLRLGFTEDSHRTGGLEHFLPHHCVVTHKFRQVLDASAHPKGQNSLNDCLFRGEVILADQVGLHMRFCLSVMPMWADVEKAFIALDLRESDREVCKMLWLKDIREPLSEENLRVLRWKRVPFGVVSSPYLLAAVILLENGGHAFGLGTSTQLFCRQSADVLCFG